MTMAYAVPNPDRRRARVGTLHVDRMAEWLIAMLGRRLTAYAAGAESPRAVDDVAHGEGAGAELERGLRDLYAVASTLTAADGPGSAHAWLTEPNPDLGDRSPASVLHEGEGTDALWPAAAARPL